MNCLFCDIVAGEIPSDLVVEDETGVVFLDLHPKQPGHALVVPRRHVADLADDAQAFVEVAPLVARTATLVQQRLGADGVNLVVNSGAAAGQEVAHLHVHVVPRYATAPARTAREDVRAALTRADGS